MPLAAPSSLAMVGMTNYSPSSNAINVLLADSKQMENQLLAGSLKERGFQVLTCASELPPILELFEGELPDVAVISCAAAYSVAPLGFRRSALWIREALNLLCKRFDREHGVSSV